MWLDSDPHGTGWPMGLVATLAMICGIPVVPLLLNAAFYWAMPERYVVWHLLMVTSTLVQAAILTGLIPQLLPLSYGLQVAISDVSFAALTAGTLMFLRAWIEPEMHGQRAAQDLHRTPRRAAQEASGGVERRGDLRSDSA